MLCLAVHTFEVLVIRTDETFFAECFINKVFGIIVLYAVLKNLKWHWSDIGFIKEKMLINVLKGFGLCSEETACPNPNKNLLEAAQVCAFCLLPAASCSGRGIQGIRLFYGPVNGLCAEVHA